MALVCANCACFVGSLGTQLGLLERSLSRQELLNDNLQHDGDKEITPIIAVTKKAQIVSGNLVIDIPFVLKFITVTI